MDSMQGVNSSSIPEPDALLNEIAQQAMVDADEAATVLGTYDIDLTHIPPIPRHLSVRRLRIAGVKTGTKQFDGPFDREFEFEDGLNILSTEKNLRGKTSVLEVIAWCLRGTPKKLRTSVRPWLRVIELDFEVANEAAGVRLDLTNGLSGYLIRAESVDALDDGTDSQGQLQTFDSEASFAAVMNTFMMARLDLSAITHWHRYDKAFEDGQAGFDRWPSLFGAIYLPDGGDSNLLGDTHMNGLPGRLLQLYLSLPFAPQLTKLKVARQSVSQVERNSKRRAREDAEARIEDRAEVELQLAAARNRLDSIKSGPSAPDARDLSRRLDQLNQDSAMTQRQLMNAMQVLATARAARIEDQQRIDDAMETALATRLFQGLQPHHCPRCEAPVPAERLQLEKSDHACAMCATELDLEEPPSPSGNGVDSPAADEEEASAASVLEASRAAERAAEEAVEDARRELDGLQQDINAIVEQLEASRATEATNEKYEQELLIARLEGRLSAIPQAFDAETIEFQSADSRVLAAAEEVLDRQMRRASAGAFEEIEKEIVDLARQFGIGGITAAKTNFAARLRTTIDGSESNFGDLSRGERLRLRVATVLALLRVGIRHRIGTHPGLVIIDSPASEEVNPQDVRALINAISQLSPDVPGLQVIIATAQPGILDGIEVATTYGAIGNDPLW